MKKERKKRVGFKLPPGPNYSWRKVTFWMILSFFLLTCPIIGGTLMWRRAPYFQFGEPIKALVQTSSHYAPLPTLYLAEVLNLSSDHPTLLNSYNLEAAKERLCATYLIKSALLKKVLPDTLYIDYEVREPIAYLGDYSNTVLDEEGMFFPLNPFYSLRTLPEIYLGANAFPSPWGGKMEESHLKIIKEFFTLFGSKNISRLDLSYVESESAGTRQIILILKNGVILRLSAANYSEEIKHYFVLVKEVLKKEPSHYIVDLRIPDVAYIQKVCQKNLS